jgi:hypothetical protein
MLLAPINKKFSAVYRAIVAPEAPNRNPAPTIPDPNKQAGHTPAEISSISFDVSTRILSSLTSFVLLKGFYSFISSYVKFIKVQIVRF